jgi:hypothetical protein
MLSVLNKLKMKIEKTHHKNAYFEYNGKLHLKTRISHGKGDIPKPVIERIRKQLFLDHSQFKDLVNCPLGYEEFVEILKDRNIIST